MLTPPFQSCQRGLIDVPAVAIAEGQRLRIQLPISALVERYTLNLRGTITIPGGGVAVAGTAKAWNAANIIREVAMTLGSLGQIKRSNGIALLSKAIARERVIPAMDDLTTAEIAAAGAYTYACSLPIDFAQFGFDAEEIGLLVSQAETQIDLDVVLGTFAADMQVGGTYTYTNAATVDLVRSTLYPADWDPSYGTFREDFVRLTPTVAGWADVRLPPKKFFRALHLISYAAAAPADVLSDAVLVAAELQLNSATIPLRATAAQIRESMVQRQGWPVGLAPPTGFNRWEPSRYSPLTFPRVGAGIDGTLATEINLRLNCLAPAGAVVEIHYEILDPPGVQ